MAWWVISSMVAPVALFALGANVHDICALFCAPEGLIVHVQNEYSVTAHVPIENGYDLSWSFWEQLKTSLLTYADSQLDVKLLLLAKNNTLYNFVVVCSTNATSLFSPFLLPQTFPSIFDRWVPQITAVWYSYSPGAADQLQWGVFKEQHSDVFYLLHLSSLGFSPKSPKRRQLFDGEYRTHRRGHVKRCFFAQHCHAWPKRSPVACQVLRVFRCPKRLPLAICYQLVVLKWSTLMWDAWMVKVACWVSVVLPWAQKCAGWFWSSFHQSEGRNSCSTTMLYL